MFEDLLATNCYSSDPQERTKAAEQLELRYGCEINCTEIAHSVRFAHHARGCTIIAAKLCEGVVIFQNVTIGSNLKYNKLTDKWENVGNPVIGENVVIADGAKVLGPIIIGANTVVAAGAIITQDIPADSIAYGVNRYKPKDPDYALVFHPNMIDSEEIIAANHRLIEKYQEKI